MKNRTVAVVVRLHGRRIDRQEIPVLLEVFFGVKLALGGEGAGLVHPEQRVQDLPDPSCTEGCGVGKPSGAV